MGLLGRSSLKTFDNSTATAVTARNSGWGQPRRVSGTETLGAMSESRWPAAWCGPLGLLCS